MARLVGTIVVDPVYRQPGRPLAHVSQEVEERSALFGIPSSADANTASAVRRVAPVAAPMEHRDPDTIGRRHFLVTAALTVGRSFARVSGRPHARRIRSLCSCRASAEAKYFRLASLILRRVQPSALPSFPPRSEVTVAGDSAPSPWRIPAEKRWRKLAENLHPLRDGAPRDDGEARSEVASLDPGLPDSCRPRAGDHPGDSGRGGGRHRDDCRLGVRGLRRDVVARVRAAGGRLEGGFGGPRETRPAQARRTGSAMIRRKSGWPSSRRRSRVSGRTMPGHRALARAVGHGGKTLECGAGAARF